MTITAGIARRDTPNVLLEKRSPVNILFSSALPGLGLESRVLFPANGRLYSFDGTQVRVLGYLNLLASIGLLSAQAGMVARFLIVDHPSPYLAIFGHPLLWTLRVTLCYYTRTLRLPTFRGTTTIFADHPGDSNPVCALSAEGPLLGPMEDPREERPRPQPLEDLETVVISNDHLDQSASVPPTAPASSTSYGATPTASHGRMPIYQGLTPRSSRTVWVSIRKPDRSGKSVDPMTTLGIPP
ncbi:unnamed protein product [Prunus armeniaca]